MNEIAVSVDRVSKKFKDKTVLNNVSIDFERGKIHGIIGRNGSGKTVLFKCICGLTLCSSGTITVNGKIIGKDVDIPDQTGIIIEEPGFLPNYSGYKNLMLLASINKTISKEDVKRAMDIVGLDPNNKKSVGKYSLGMRQRLGIAQAIMEKPQLLILDEPMNGLDKQGVEDVKKLLLDLAKDGTTIIMASHNMDDINSLCETISEIDAGVLKRLV